MECSKCGASNDSRAKFCIRCGARLGMANLGELPADGQQRRVWKWLALGCAGFVVVGSVLVGIGVYFGYRALKEAIVTDPVRVEQIARTIVDYEIPGGSKGVIAMEIAGSQWAMVQSQEDPEGVMLILASAPNTWAGNLEDQLEQAFSGLFDDEKTYQNENVRYENVRLCEQMVTARIEQGYMRDEKASKPMTSIQVSVPDEKRRGYVIAAGLGEGHEEKAYQLFEALRCVDR